MRGIPLRTGVAAAVALCSLGGAALAAQDRYTLKVPDGLGFAEFRGYDTWETVAVSQTKGAVKVISGNPVMMKAFKSGLPAAGRKFPEGSKVVKIEWAQRQDATSPYFVMVPGDLMSVSFIEKDSKRFPKTHGWAYAKFVVDPATQTFRPEGTGAECGHACHSAAVAAQDYIFTAYPRR